MKSDVWQNSYDASWKGLIIPEAFTHPAKFSRGLIRKIYEHAIGLGWIKAGSCVLDPFGGAALGGLDAVLLGLNWTGIELEEKFCRLAKENIAKWQKDLQGQNKLGVVKIIQGDSRRIEEIVEEANIVISSPPYAERSIGAGGLNTKPPKHTGQQSGRSPGSPSQNTNQHYGDSNGQLAEMKEGDFQAVISSPPYAEARIGQESGQEQCGHHDAYSRSAGQLGAMKNDTFWSSSKQIVQGCYNLLKPGGHAIWVTKAYCKKGAIVDFPGRWGQLCESVGFKPVCRHKAMLVKRHGTQTLLDGGKEELTTSRKSFFRRLAEKKGSPRIDWEEVLCFVK